jgi:hypothetical protein
MVHLFFKKCVLCKSIDNHIHVRQKLTIDRKGDWKDMDTNRVKYPNQPAYSRNLARRPEANAVLFRKDYEL